MTYYELSDVICLYDLIYAYIWIKLELFLFGYVKFWEV